MTDKEFAKIEKDYAEWRSLPDSIERYRKAMDFVAVQFLEEDHERDARTMFERDFPALLAEVKRLRSKEPRP